MRLCEVVSAVTKMEGKKSNVKIGDVREVLRCLRDVCQESDAWSVVQNYLRYGSRDQLVSKRRKKRATK